MVKETPKATKKQKELEDSLKSIRDFISTNLRMIYTYDIVDIAQKSNHK